MPIRVEGETRYSLSVSAQLNFAGPTIVERYLPDLIGTATTIASLLAAKT